MRREPGKTILTGHGPLRMRSPRDRKGTFEPEIVKKRQTRCVGFDEKVISPYARGLTVREIQGTPAHVPVSGNSCAWLLRNSGE